jgi:folate-dependent tRNA-U54 methylase TrmFO/GidA
MDNKFSKYLLYAIGEVLLVVIGILIALQVDNWNNEKASEDREIKILTQIKRNLAVNVDQFSAEIANQESIVESIDVIVYQIKNNIPYHDSLGPKYAAIAWTEEFSAANSAFQTLKTLGFDLISSDSLRESIIQLFGIRYVRFSDVIAKVSSTEHIQLNSMYAQHIEYDKQGNGIVNDFEELANDRAFTNMLSNRRIWKTDIVNEYKELLVESLELSEMIDRELQRRY